MGASLTGNDIQKYADWRTMHDKTCPIENEEGVKIIFTFEYSGTECIKCTVSCKCGEELILYGG